MIKALFTTALLLAADQAGNDLDRVATFGHKAFAKGDFAGAANWYEQAASLAPDTSEANFDLALTWYRRGSYELAGTYLDHAQSTAQGDTLARCLQLRADLSYRDALKQNPIRQVEALEQTLKLYRIALNAVAPGSQTDDIRYDIEAVKLRLLSGRKSAPSMESPQSQQEASAEEIGQDSAKPESAQPNQSRPEDRDW